MYTAVKAKRAMCVARPFARSYSDSARPSGVRAANAEPHSIRPAKLDVGIVEIRMLQVAPKLGDEIRQTFGFKRLSVGKVRAQRLQVSQPLAQLAGAIDIAIGHVAQADVRPTELAHTTCMNPGAAELIFAIAHDQQVIAGGRTVGDEVTAAPCIGIEQADDLRIEDRRAAHIKQ